MSSKSENSQNGVQPVPLSDVYRQLDDHLAENETPYDVAAGLGRLMEWMGEEVPRAQLIDDLDEGREAGLRQAGVLAPRSDDAVLLLAQRGRLLGELAARRTRSALLIFTMVLAFGVLTGALLAVAPHPTTAVVVAMSVITALVTFAGVYLHRTTMQPLRVDPDLAHETWTSDREVTGEAERQPNQPDSAIDDTVDRSETRQEGHQPATWTGRRGYVPRVVATGLIGLAAAGIVKDTYVPLGVVGALLLTIITGVIFPAIWSRDLVRRQNATRLLQILLGQAPNLPARSKDRGLSRTAASKRKSVGS